MISNKTRENRRAKSLKMPKNIERLYKDGKCSECSVVVTRMDFARILGKFTKVKIQYESGSSTPKTKKNSQQSVSPNSNTRLKSNENGMVLIHRNAYSQHPVQELLNSKKTRTYERTSRLNNNVKDNKITSTPKPNILRENNRLKKTPAAKDKELSHDVKNVINSNIKKYGIIFTNPSKKNNNENKSNQTLTELLPSIDKSILPAEDWCIDYLPKSGEPKEDKVYDRIAAELEDLMYNEKSTTTTKSGPKAESSESKDEFPSIMDILNENPSESIQNNAQSNQVIQPNLESSDVEAMLLGKPSESNKESEQTAMEVDNSVISNLINVVSNTDNTDSNNLDTNVDLMDNPHSPSILDEALQTGIEEHLPKEISLQENCPVDNITMVDNNTPQLGTKLQSDEDSKNKGNSPEINFNSVTHVVFKQYLDGQCLKSVTCPKNLKYIVELKGKSVEFLGAPKFISSIEDLHVLLQIVNETELSSLYITH